MRLGMLGPLLVADEAGRPVRLPGRARMLLAALALRANQVVPAEELADLLFDGAPTAGSTLRSNVRRLRTGLGPAWARRIVTQPPGYLCRADESEVDVLAFRALCRRVGAALQGGQWAEASGTAERALALWRGVPLLDVGSQVLRDEFVPWLEQLRTQLLEDQADADLRLGRHERLVQPLRELVAQHPLRERFRAQLVIALALSGRRAEALTAYQDARKTLVGDLGVEPGPELRDLHERILAGEDVRPCSGLSGASPGSAPPTIASSSERMPGPLGHGAVPRQLPAAAGHFTGRHAELAWLSGLADFAEPRSGAGDTVVISAIDGMAGIGKTALAVRVAHRLADRFGDGQLFIDLHGYTEGQPPLEPGRALETLLRSLEVPAPQIPEDTQGRAAFYRQRLAGTRTLILLDNAAGEAQVRPLLPGAPGCLVLVTSRRRLKGLDDARTLSLDVLPEADAVVLLRTVIGPDRVPADEPLLGEIARRCGRLPLALRIAGALLRHRPTWSLPHLAGLLDDERRRVATLSDGERDLGAVFELSYRNLAEQHRALFRRLGLIPGPSLDVYAAAALLETDPATASGLLEDLVDHNLLLCYAPGRYRLHDLLRAHACALAEADHVAEPTFDPLPERTTSAAFDREGALDRLLRYYAHAAHSASATIARCSRPVPAGPAPAYAPPALNDPEVARAWLRTERDNLEHAYAFASSNEMHAHTLSLAAGLGELLRTDGPYARALTLHQAAANIAKRHGRPAEHAYALVDLGVMQCLSGSHTDAEDTLGRALQMHRATGDRHGEADTLTELARAQSQTGYLTEGDDSYARALEIYRATGDRHGEADVLADLGAMRRLMGNPADAENILIQALRIYQETDDQHGVADALTELGRARGLMGKLAEAEEALGRALEFYRATGHHHGEAYVLTNLGTVRRLVGDREALRGAEAVLSQALEIYRSVGYPQGEAEALANLGTVRRLTGDLRGAEAALNQALEIYRAISHRHDEVSALNQYAATAAADGDLPRAVTLYQEALVMSRELKKADEEAVALEGLGECRLARGETESAIADFRRALAIYQGLDMAVSADRVRTRLDAHSSSDGGCGPIGRTVAGSAFPQK